MSPALDSPVAVRVAVGVYGIALHAFPREFRRRFGRDLVATFRDDARAALRRGGRSLSATAARATFDALVQGLVERLEHAGLKRPAPSGGARPPSSPRSPSLMLDALLQDLRFALRTLAASRTFTVVVVVTLAVGIGAVTAVFSAVNGIVLRPLPYPDPDRLVMIWQPGEDRPDQDGAVSPVDLEDWKRMSSSFISLGGMRSWRPTITDVEVPEGLAGYRMSPEALEALGIEPRLGRLLRPDEHGPDTRLALVSHGFWQRKLGADPDVVGSSIVLDDEAWRILGVMPAGFRMPGSDSFDVIGSMRLDPAEYSRGSRFLRALARLAPGVGIDEAQADMTRIAAALASEYPDSNQGILARVVPLHEEVLGGVDRPLYLLLGAVAFVLLITVANVANLMLARGAARGHELAVRAALGAGSGRIVRQLLTEALLLAAAGGAAGVLLARLGVEGLIAAAPEGLPRTDAVAVDGTVLAVAACVSLVAGLGFGLFPALRARRPAVDAALRSSRGDSAGVGSHTRQALVAVQIAVALVLLIGSGLLINSLARLLAESPGFDPEGVMAVRVRLGGKYAGVDEQERFFDALLERLDSHPAVAEATVTFLAPFSGANIAGSFTRVGKPEPAEGEEPSAAVNFVAADLFDVLRVPIRSGRGFEPDDTRGSEPVAVINEAAARMFWPGEDPVGQELRLHVSVDAQEPDVPRRIVGIVADVKHRTLESAAPPMLFAPAAQRPTSSMFVLLRGREGFEGLAQALRQVLDDLDPNVPLSRVETLTEMIGATVARDRFAAWLLSCFAAAALLLGCVGVYGVVGYAVTERTGEFGVRIALGARSADIHRLVLRDTAIVAAIGLGAGVLGSLALGRFLDGMLHEVSAADPATFGAMTGLLLAATFLAAAVPARRAARVDPLTSLRAD